MSPSGVPVCCIRYSKLIAAAATRMNGEGEYGDHALTVQPIACCLGDIKIIYFLLLVQWLHLRLIGCRLACRYDLITRESQSESGIANIHQQVSRLPSRCGLDPKSLT